MILWISSFQFSSFLLPGFWATTRSLAREELWNFTNQRKAPKQPLKSLSTYCLARENRTSLNLSSHNVIRLRHYYPKVYIWTPFLRLLSAWLRTAEKKKLSRLPVLRREAIAFEVGIREGEDETIVRNTSLQDLHCQHWRSCRSAPKKKKIQLVHSNDPPKSCSGCKSLDVFWPQGPELKWFIRRAPPLSLHRPIAVGAMYLQSLSTTGGWNRASWKRFLIETRKMFKTTIWPNLVVSCMLYPLHGT